MRQKVILIFFAFTHFMLLAQHKVSGIIKDISTDEPLAFVNITYNNNPYKGTISDIDGQFVIESNEKITSLQISYIGYETQKANITKERNLILFLNPSTEDLNEVVISSINPANAIIEKIIENREKNHPKNIEKYQHRSYNKTIFDYKTDSKKNDSLFDVVLKGGHISVMESVTEKKFIKPDLVEETVIANKVSGFKNPMFVALATDMQPFTFYDENIELLTINFLNPISNGALKKYDYRLKETFYRESDTIYVISFIPKKNKNFEGLQGILYINKDKYAIQNVIASPAEEMKAKLKIQQQYQRIENETWFPEQLNYELKFKAATGEENDWIVANGKSYISEVNLQPNFTKKDFSALSVKIDDKAAEKDSLYWESYRKEDLTNEEKITYRVIDSLGKKYKFDKFLSYFEKLPQGKLPIGFIDLDLIKTFIYNKHEGYRFGTGLYTNDKLIKNLEIGGYFGYGQNDEEWKYGTSATYHILKEKEFFIKAGYKNDIKEIGSYGLARTENVFGDLRDYMIEKVDHIKAYEFSTGFRTLKYLKVNLVISQAEINPLNNYNFNTPFGYSSFRNSTASVSLRYAFREKIVQTFHQNVSLGTKYPVFSLKFTKAFKYVFKSDLDYQKIEARITQSIFFRNFGRSTYRLDMGYVDRLLPEGLMFTGEGGYDREIPALIPNTFQTMQPYEFLSDKYVDLFLSHNFGSLLLKEGNFNPEIIVHHNLGWGELSHGNFSNYKTKENLYTEAGLELAKIIQINYLDIGYFNLGAGGFYRYGAYQLNSFSDNFAFKVRLGFSFN